MFSLSPASDLKDRSVPVSYEYPRPALTTDCVIFGLDDEGLKVLLIEREREPFAGRWAFPGGFVEMEEDLEQAAARELAEETGLRDIELEQLQAFGGVDRDPRERVVSVAHYALVALTEHHAEAADDARNVDWYPVDEVPPLAFDHPQMLQMARARLQAKMRYQPMGLGVLPAEFTLPQLQHLYEAVLGRQLDDERFASAILGIGILRPTSEEDSRSSERGSHRYAFDHEQYQQMVEQGIYLQL